MPSGHSRFRLKIQIASQAIFAWILVQAQDNASSAEPAAADPPANSPQHGDEKGQWSHAFWYTNHTEPASEKMLKREHYHFDHPTIYVSPQYKDNHEVIDLTTTSIQRYCNTNPKLAERCQLALLPPDVKQISLGDKRPWTFLGCFRDMPAPRAFPLGPHEPLFNTLDCKRACSKYKYFALQNTWCGCGNDDHEYKMFGKVDEDECGGPSIEDPYFGRLGRNWKNAVYKQEPSILTESPMCDRAMDLRWCEREEKQCGMLQDTKCGLPRNCGFCSGYSYECIDHRCVKAGDFPVYLAKNGQEMPNMAKIWSTMEDVYRQVNQSAEYLVEAQPNLGKVQNASEKLHDNATTQGQAQYKEMQKMYGAIKRIGQRAVGAQTVAEKSQHREKKVLTAFEDSVQSTDQIKQNLFSNVESAMRDATQSKDVIRKAEETQTSVFQQAKNAEMSTKDEMNEAKAAQNSLVKDVAPQLNSVEQQVKSLKDEVFVSDKEARRIQKGAEQAAAQTRLSESASREALQLSKHALEETNSISFDSKALIEKAREQIKQAALATQQEKKNAEAAAVSAKRSQQAAESAQASRKVASETLQMSQQISQKSNFAITEATQAGAAARHIAEEAKVVVNNVEEGKQAQRTAMSMGREAVHESRLLRHESKKAARAAEDAVYESKAAVKASREAEKDVAASIQEGATSLKASEETLKESKEAEGNTKKSLAFANVVKKQADQAIAESQEASKEASKSVNEVSSLTSELQHLEGREAQLNGALAVIEGQVQVNKKQATALDKQDHSMRKTAALVSENGAVLNDTMTWSASLAEGLEKNMKTMESHGESMGNELELDKAQGEALERQDKALQRQTDLLNVTVRSVSALSQGVSHHQTSLTRALDQLMASMIATAKNNEKLHLHQIHMNNLVLRIGDLEANKYDGIKKVEGNRSHLLGFQSLKDTMNELHENLTQIEQGNLAANARSLATHDTALLLRKHFNVLDTDYVAMADKLGGGQKRKKENSQALHVVESNEKESRHDYADALKEMSDYVARSNKLAAHSEILHSGIAYNAHELHKLVTTHKEQVQHITDLFARTKNIAAKEAAAHEMSQVASTFSEAKLHDVRESEKDVAQFEKILDAEIGTSEGEKFKALMDKINKESQEGDQMNEKLNSKVFTITQDDLEKTMAYSHRILDVEDRVAIVESRSNHILSGVAFGIFCAVFAMFIVSIIITNQIAMLQDKLPIPPEEGEKKEGEKKEGEKKEGAKKEGEKKEGGSSGSGAGASSSS